MGTMVTRCEYCGQLFDGLSCPHCGAPRGDDDSSVGIFYADNVPYWRSDVGFIDCDGNPVAIDSASNDSAVSQTVVGNGNVSVCGNGNIVHTDITPHCTDDWVTWPGRMDMKPDTEPDPEPELEPDDWAYVGIDPYKDDPISRVGVPEPVTVEDREPLKFGCLLMVLIGIPFLYGLLIVICSFLTGGPNV